MRCETTVALFLLFRVATRQAPPALSQGTEHHPKNDWPISVAPNALSPSLLASASSTDTCPHDEGDGEIC